MYKNKAYETVLDFVNQGVILIDNNGTISLYNKKAKEIFGIIYHTEFGHKSGRIEDGDIVIIGDTSLGKDDGGLLQSDLSLIGVDVKTIKDGAPFCAVGVKGGEGVFSNKLNLNHKIKGHGINISIDFEKNIVDIKVNDQSFQYKFIESVGHMVVLDGKTGDIKFYQAMGYTARREDIKSLLYGKSYMAKGDIKEEINLIGKSIFDVHPRESNIDIVEFLEAAKGKDIKYTNQVKEINGRPTRCTLTKIKDMDSTIGALLLVEDITELKSVMDERDYVIESYISREEKDEFCDIVGQSESIKTVKRLAKKASESDSTVLLLGESGTGKGRLAQCIHRASKRNKNHFIYVNLASIPENLLESELFGYESGSFTGAKKEGKPGIFELANGGTIFLDEIGEIPFFMQVKLLHVLQSKTLRRIGGVRDIELDIKIITATNKDLEKAVKDGTFRKDLFYRINVFPIYIPPLRYRQEDIFALIYALLPHICESCGIENMRISGEAVRMLCSYSWPGNVRELENVLERAANIADGEIILKEHLNIRLEREENYYSDGFTTNQVKPLHTTLEEAEKNAIINALKAAEGNKNQAMKILSIGKTSFYEKLKKYNIK